MNLTSKNPKSIVDALGPKLVAKLVKLVKMVKLVVKLVKLVTKLVKTKAFMRSAQLLLPEALYWRSCAYSWAGYSAVKQMQLKMKRSSITLISFSCFVAFGFGWVCRQRP